MRLLIISNNPDRASFRQRIGNYLDLLRDRGIECEVVRLPAGMLKRREVFASARHFDGVLLHRKMLNAWDAFWLRRYCGKVIYDFDDAIMYSDRRPERISRARFRRFGRPAGLSDLVIAGNDYLAEHARRYNRNVRVLPTGLDVGAYRAAGQRERGGSVRLIWIGSRSTLKYLSEIRPALEELGRRFDQVRLRMICNEFFDLESMRVEKCAWSSQTEAADLVTSDIGLAPLPDNPFTRGKCGFKILQYHAAGLPVVASPVGVNAQYAREGVTGLLATTESEWVEKLSQLIEDAQLREQMGREGLRTVGSFDVSVIGQEFTGLIASCLQSPTP